jgi:arylsulfatase A-like enzyme
MEGTFTGKVNLLSRYVLTTRDWPILKTYVKRYLRKFNTPDPMACSTKYSLKSLQGGLEIIRKHSLFNDSSPYFLFINLMEAHHFYNPPSQVRKFSSPKDKQTFPTSSFYNVNRLKKCGNLIPNWINLYDDEIVYLDSLLGSFYDHLKQNNLLDNTVLIFTSDHGEHFGEKGHYEHRLSLYNELIWVPLLLKLPGSLAFPGVRDRLTSLNDLFSTILDLAESPWPHPFTSNSLLDNEAPGTTASMIIDSRPWQDRMTADFGHNQRWLQGLRSHRFALMLEEGWKLIEGEDGRLEVYNLSHAPLEDRDLLQDLPSDLQGNFQELFRLQKGKILSATS